MSIESAIQSIPEDLGLNYLEEYYSSPSNEDYSGAHFESIEQHDNYRDKISAADLVAVSTLQTPIGGSASVGILITEAQRISSLLSEITTQSIAELSPEGYEQQLGTNSPAMQLWKLLTRTRPGDTKWGIGATRASKIMARKRPHLIPIRDSIIDEVVGHSKRDNSWKLWWDALHGNSELELRADRMRKKLKRDYLSTLRIYDVMLWYSGKYGQHSN